MTIKGDVVIHRQKLGAQQSRTESCKPYTTGDWLAAFVANNRAAETKLEVLRKCAKTIPTIRAKTKEACFGVTVSKPNCSNISIAPFLIGFYHALTVFFRSGKPPHPDIILLVGAVWEYCFALRARQRTL